LGDDGGPATSGRFSIRCLSRVDLAGTCTLPTPATTVIRRVSGGTITTVAGNGTADFSGDGGPATSASLKGRWSGRRFGGNLYIADTLNNRIRRVSGGMITTVAGNGDYQYSGDGGPAVSAALSGPKGVAVDSAGNLYIADYGITEFGKLLAGPSLRSPEVETRAFQATEGRLRAHHSTNPGE